EQRFPPTSLRSFRGIVQSIAQDSSRPLGLATSAHCGRPLRGDERDRRRLWTAMRTHVGSFVESESDPQRTLNRLTQPMSGTGAEAMPHLRKCSRTTGQGEAIAFREL